MHLTILFTLFAAAPPQEMTARQLFFVQEGETKPKVETKKAETKKAETRKAAPPQKKSASQSRPGPPGDGGTPLVEASLRGPAAKPLGLRYSLLQLIDSTPVEVSPDHVFHSGDQVRLRVEGNRGGHLYVIARGSSGVWKPLFPSADIAGGDNRIEARRRYDLPSSDHAFTFDEQTGEEQLFVVYSEKPVADLDELIYTLRGPDKPPQQPALLAENIRPINDSVVGKLRNAYARDLIIQKLDAAKPAPKTEEKPESAVYIVSKAGGRLVADIKLVHR